MAKGREGEIYRVRYRRGGMTVVMELRGDWADICNEVRKRLYPGEQIDHHAVSKKRRVGRK